MSSSDTLRTYAVNALHKRLTKPACLFSNAGRMRQDNAGLVMNVTSSVRNLSLYTHRASRHKRRKDTEKRLENEGKTSQKGEEGC